MILSNSSGITAAGDLATRILAFVRDSSVLDRLLLGQSIELIRLGTQMNSPTVKLTVRPNGADHQWKEDPYM